jgi:hypothetical protein
MAGKYFASEALPTEIQHHKQKGITSALSPAGMGS